MNFTNKQIERLLAGDSVVLTVPKKEGEMFHRLRESIWSGEMGSKKKPLRIKWQVGRDYSVMQIGESVWHCPKCKTITEPKIKYACCAGGCPNVANKPLRFVVKKITSKNKEWLLEVEKNE